jgi:putative Holliday junction resolvase
VTRVIGIDYGESRIGIAVAETEIGIAHPHSVIETNDKALENIASIVREDGIERIVVGLPRNMDGTEGGQAASARAFAEKLSADTGIEIIFQDERLTSKQAEDILLTMDKSRDARKAKADAHQAAIILQTYLDSTEDGNNAWDS